MSEGVLKPGAYHLSEGVLKPGAHQLSDNIYRLSQLAGEI